MNGFSVQLFWILLLCGTLMIGAEVFVPGGILGLLGALALLGAVASAFAAFGPATGLFVAMGIVLLAALSIVLWIVFFPRTTVGRKLTLSQDGREFRLRTEETPSLEGAHGVARSDLRPSGIAEINGQRMDVVAEGGWIEQGRTLKVVQVGGNRVVVREDARPETGQEQEANTE